METLIRTLLLRLPGRGFASAWVVVFALALCGSFGYAAEHAGYASGAKELHQLLEKHAASSQHRRLVVGTQFDRASKHGSAGSGPGIAAASPFSPTYHGAEALSVIAAAVFVPKRRVSSANPRAPPR